MKKVFTVLSAIALTASFTSCGGSAPKEAKVEKSQESVCKYEYNYMNSSIGFGGFKTTDKVEVKGSFNEFKIHNTVKAETAEEVFANASFDVFTKSVKTGNPDRDMKIANNFFGTMIATDTISGEVKSIDKAAGEILIDFKLNDITKELKLAYTEAGDTVRLSGVLNLLTFEAQPAVDALNEVCYDLHKGPDGVSKTWAEANIYIESVLRKDCK